MLQSYRLNSLLSLRHEHCLFPSNLTLSLLPTDIDECSSNPCRNGGLCVDLINSYQCVCQPGYNGINCKIGEHYFHIMSKHLSLFRRGWVGERLLICLSFKSMPAWALKRELISKIRERKPCIRRIWFNSLVDTPMWDPVWKEKNPAIIIFLCLML